MDRFLIPVLDGVQHPRASFFFENPSQEHDAL